MSDIPTHPDSQTPVITEAPPIVAPPHASHRPSPLAVRLWSAFILAIAAGMLGVGLYLTPSPTGLETHRQLGLPPCSWLTTWGFPCPTCGCTTAVSNFSHGHLLKSFLTQPFGFIVALIAALMTPLTAIGLATGRWLGPSTFWLGWHWRWWLFGGSGFLIGGWIYKIITYKAMWHP